jgi:hypothetical protein
MANPESVLWRDPPLGGRPFHSQPPSMARRQSVAAQTEGISAIVVVWFASFNVPMTRNALRLSLPTILIW